MENKQILQDLNNYNRLVTQRPFATYSEDARNDNVPTSSGQRSTSPDKNITARTSTVEDSSVYSSFTGSLQKQENPEYYTQNNLSDMETVSTKADEETFKALSPRLVTPNTKTYKENNDNEPDMGTDIDKTHPKFEESIKEKSTVTSTAEINSEIISLFLDVNLSSEKVNNNSKNDCPSLNIYSKESIKMAKSTDINLNLLEDKNKDTNTTEENNKVGEVNSLLEQEKNKQKKLMSTEDHIKEEKSYTPCVNKKPQSCKKGLKDLDTEPISDESSTDFNEPYNIKKASDEDSLSDLTFTTSENYEEGETVNKLINKNISENTNKKPTSKKRKKSHNGSKVASKKHKSRSRSRNLKRSKKWAKRHSRDWTPSLSRSRSPDPNYFSPSRTPSRIIDNTVNLHNLTLVATNNKGLKTKRNDRTPLPSRKVFASGVSTKKKKKLAKSNKKKKNRDLSKIESVALVDLTKLTPSPKDVIELSDSENEEQVTSSVNNYITASETLLKPQFEFTLIEKQPQMPAITNLLHESDIKPKDATQENVGEFGLPKAPNTSSKPSSSSDVYDPFQPTKSPSSTLSTNDAQLADTQSSIEISPESNLHTSLERYASSSLQSHSIQTSLSTPTSLTSTPVDSSLTSSENEYDSVEQNLSFNFPYSPRTIDYEDLYESMVETTPEPPTKTADEIKSKLLFKTTKLKQDEPAGTSVKINKDYLKMFNELPNSAAEMQAKNKKQKLLIKLSRQERITEEVKVVLEPYYRKKRINKNDYKYILKRAVPQIYHNKTGEINPAKIRKFIEAYVKKVSYSKN